MNRKLLVLPILAILVMSFVAPIVSETNASGQDDIYIHQFDEVSMKANSSTTIEFTIINKSADDYMFQIKNYDANGISIKCTYEGSPMVEAGKHKTINATIEVSKYTRTNTYDCSIVISFDDVTKSESESVFNMTLPIKVSVTAYYSDNSYNKVLGLFTIPGIDDPVINAAITLGIWILITLLVILVYNLIIRLYFKDEKEREIAKEKENWIWFLIIMVYGIYNTLLVLGANQQIVDIYYTIMQFAYILFIALIIWNIYKALVSRFFHDMEKKEGMDGVDTSLIPLFNMIGKIVIAGVGTAVFLYAIGINIAGIIAGAGIVGLALSLGAENFLAEFFGGVSLMISHPFIKNDLVRIGSSEDVYEVIDVGLLNTEFKQWGNTAHVIMPNSIVSKSKITNCTHIPDAYRVFLYMYVGYEADMELVKKILLEVAHDHPHVIKDGTYTVPTVRLEEFGDYDVTFRLAAYVDDFDDSPTFLAEMRETAIKRLDEAKVDMPYSLYEIHKK